MRTTALSWGRRVMQRWRRSLHIRVMTTTALLGFVTISLVGVYMYKATSDGLLEDRIASAELQSRELAAQAQSVLDTTTKTRTPEELSGFANQLVEGTLKDAGSDSTRYVILTRSLSNQRPLVLDTTITGDVELSQIPDALQRAVSTDPGRQQTTVITLERSGADGAADEALRASSTVPAVVVGSRVQVPTAGPYDLYFVYPMDQEERTLQILARSFLVGALLLTGLLVGVAWLVTRQVVSPVRRAASVAERLSSGHLNERMSSQGEDDLAQLGTSFNAMADNLQTQIRQLEGLSRVQQRFVSDVSHELRTPLTTIRMAADLIHDSRADFVASVGRSAELLHTELDRFEELLADLLEISRFDAGAVVLDLAEADLGEIAARVILSARGIAAARGVEVSLHRPEAPCVAEVDSRRIERVLRNLVVNAIEHSDGQPVDVHVAASDDAVAVLVRDQGVGLRPGESSLVFNRFWRADPARTRTTGGTGLGLAIALEDARLHNGWLQAWGQSGVGSRFRLTVPVHSGVPITTSPLPLTPREGALESATLIEHPGQLPGPAGVHEGADAAGPDTPDGGDGITGGDGMAGMAGIAGMAGTDGPDDGRDDRPDDSPDTMTGGEPTGGEPAGGEPAGGPAKEQS